MSSIRWKSILLAFSLRESGLAQDLKYNYNCLKSIFLFDIKNHCVSKTASDKAELQSSTISWLSISTHAMLRFPLWKVTWQAMIKHLLQINFPSNVIPSCFTICNLQLRQGSVFEIWTNARVWRARIRNLMASAVVEHTQFSSSFLSLLCGEQSPVKISRSWSMWTQLPGTKTLAIRNAFHSVWKCIEPIKRPAIN